MLGRSIILEIFITICLIQKIKLCPPNEVIKPCRCETFFDYSSFISCSNLLSTTVFENVLNNAKDYRMSGIRLSFSSMVYLPRNIKEVKGKKPTIEIHDSTFVNLFEKEDQSVSSAMILLLDSVKIQRGFQLDELYSFKHLKILRILRLKIRGAIDMITQVSPVLEEIVLESNKIRKLSDSCFSSLNKLNTLRIANNLINRVKRNMFPSSLHVIDFTGNKIASLPDDLFSGMNSLKRVIFISNSLTAISQEIILPVIHNSLDLLQLDNNPIECGCSMNWILSVPKEITITGFCEAPLQLIGRSFRSLTPQDFVHCRYYYEVL